MNPYRCRVSHADGRAAIGRVASQYFPWREVGWNRRHLTFSFGPCDRVATKHPTSVGDAQQAVLAAMQTWRRTVPSLEFHLQVPPVDIEIGWYEPNSDPECFAHGCQLNQHDHAHADFPPPNTLFGGPPLPIHFNGNEPWSTDGHPSAFDIETVALHEIGHCLGLFHGPAGTIMEEYVWPGQVRRQLDVHTQLRIAQLYPH